MANLMNIAKFPILGEEKLKNNAQPPGKSFHVCVYVCSHAYNIGVLCCVYV